MRQIPGYQKLIDAWPAVRWFCGLATGISLWRFDFSLPQPFLILLISAPFFLLFLFWKRHSAWINPLKQTVVFITLVVTGFSLTEFHDRKLDAARELHVFHGDTISVSGSLSDFRRTARGTFSGVLRANLVKFPQSGWQVMDVGIMAEFETYLGFKYDTSGVFSIVLKPIPPHRPESKFNYPLWLNDQGITHRANVLAFESGSGFSSGWTAESRNYLFRRIDALFEPDMRGLVKALLIGYKHEIPSELKTQFSDSGLSHLMAVSGLHVIFVMSPFMLLFGWMGTMGWRKHVLIGTMAVVLFGYVLLTGSTASVIRAALMLILFTSARLYQQRASAANVLAASATLILFFRPLELFNAGFQLSYAAVALLMLFAKPVSELLPERHRETWYGKLALVAPVSLVVQIGLWPFLAWYFERVSISGPIANIAGIYLSEVFVLAGSAVLIIDAIFPALAFIFVFITHWSGVGIAETASFFGTATWSTINSAVSSATFFIFWFGLIALAARRSHRTFRVRWALFSLAALSFHFLVLAYFFDDKSELKIVFLDVGQGDAVFVETPNHKRILIDTGGLRGFGAAAHSTIIPFLKGQKIDQLDAIFITHDHLDHSAGLQAITAAIPTKSVFLPPDLRTDAFSKALGSLRNATISETGTIIRYASAGDEIALDPSVFLGVVSPFPSFLEENDKNMTSIGLLLAHGKTRFLFTGDLPEEGEDVIADAFEELLDADVIKAAHHGSRYSSTPVWLENTSPKIIVTSSAIQNRYGHPHAEAILRFQETGAQVFHTALHGNITVYDAGDPNTLIVRTSKPTGK